jgi:hypothetical protein
VVRSGGGGKGIEVERGKAKFIINSMIYRIRINECEVKVEGMKRCRCQ